MAESRGNLFTPREIGKESKMAENELNPLLLLIAAFQKVAGNYPGLSYNNNLLPE